MGETVIRVVPAASPAVLTSRPPGPCTLVIFGATGDLTRRKLVPALYNLARDGDLPESFAVVGISASVAESADFRTALRTSTEEFSRSKPLDNSVWSGFADRVETVRGDFKAPEAYEALRKTLEAVEAKRGTKGNRLYYLATVPSVFPAILRNLKAAGLLHDPGEDPWSRVVIEKPFGRDLASSRELNRLVGDVLDERQIFRIDHYLGKETVQNILVFRFGNSIFEPVWNRKYVDHVQITMAESIGVGQRGKFYDATGVVRDMIQSHVFQVLALSTMELPVSFKAEDIRDEKFKLLRAIRPIATSDVATGRMRSRRSMSATCSTGFANDCRSMRFRLDWSFDRGAKKRRNRRRRPI